MGELRVQLTPYEADFKTKLRPTSNGESLMGSTLRFMLRHPRKMGDSLTFCSEDEGVGSCSPP